ncbi:MAG: hypothetical protein K0R18_851 [Bacillales bacterium]|jgi:hypothetical protein|nr:hypothetical protein [Bacillales bacterium]
MIPKFLGKQITELQLEYKTILENAQKNIFTTETGLIIDEINVFWYSKNQLVNLIMEYIPKKNQTYVYTAAANFDFEEKGHYQFVALGNVHIFDDPLCTYAKIFDKSYNKIFEKRMKEVIKKSITENLNVINLLGYKVIILPLRFLLEEQIGEVTRLAHDAFLGLFKVRPKNIEEYFASNKSIEEIENDLLDVIKKNILFTSNEDATLPFRERFEKYKAEKVLPINDLSNDSIVFYYGTFTYLAQIIDILATCIPFKVVPFLRFEVTFSYLLLLLPNFRSQDTDELFFRSIISHYLFKYCNFEKAHALDFNKYCELVQKYRFEEKILIDLEESGCSLDRAKPDIVINILNNHIDLMLSEK